MTARLIAGALAVVVLLLGTVAFAATPIQIIIITARKDGFQPANLTVASGRMLLVIHNRTRRPAVTLHFDDDKGNTLVGDQLHSFNASNAWHELNLQPGVYKLKSPDDTSWSFTLTVR
jgi:hypothetical protein